MCLAQEAIFVASMLPMETSQLPESPEASQEHDAITRLRDQFGPPPEGVPSTA